jgi:hypothetical protein
MVEVKTIVGAVARETHGFVARPFPKVRDAVDLVVDGKQFDKEEHNLLIVVDYHWPPLSDLEAVDALYGTSVLAHDTDVRTGEPVGGWYESRQLDGRWKSNLNTRIGAVGFIRGRGNAEFGAYFIHNLSAIRPLRPRLFDPWPQLVRGTEPGTIVWRNPVDAA